MPWHDPEELAGQQARLAAELERRRQAGEPLEVFEAPSGKKLTHQFWGGAWARHLVTCCGYDRRLDQGRSCLRRRQVMNLAVAPGLITAEVADDRLYGVRITVKPVPQDRFAAIQAACADNAGSLLDILSGNLSDAVMRLVTDPEHGLFPDRGEIRHQCTCPDDADLCRHQAAVLYALAILFDRDPALFFRLRGADPARLAVSAAGSLYGPHPDLPGPDGTGPGPANEELEALFGIELSDPGAAP